MKSKKFNQKVPKIGCAPPPFSGLNFEFEMKKVDTEMMNPFNSRKLNFWSFQK